MKTMLRSAVLAGLLSAGGATIGAGQAINACYVPAVGALYLVGLTGLSTACVAPGHVAISLSSGAASIGDGAVTTAKIADGAVTSAKIASGGVLAGHIAPNAISGGHIAANAVGTAQIAGGAIQTSDIAEGAVTASKLGPGVSRAIQWASVRGSDGVPFQNTGSITGSRISTGNYRLVFPANVVGCVLIATPADGPHITQTVAGPRFGGGSNEMSVTVTDHTGALVNAGFEVAVICR